MSNAANVLIIDDETKVLILLSDSLREHGFSVQCAASGPQALTLLKAEEIQAIILDLMMPGMDGMAVLREIKRTSPRIPVIMLTGHGTIDRAVEAVKLGAFDFLEKPVSSEKIVVSIQNALKQARLEHQTSSLMREVQEPFRMIGNAPVLEEIRRTIDKVADSDLPVLITGESGTGKELVARAIHFKSRRAGGPFVALNCSAIPGELLESELFGHEKGAFTGAHQATTGLFEQADQSTLFLDEISDMDIHLQPKLLRALESMRIKKVGAAAWRSVDVRLISASNRDLGAAMKKGEFRKDLYYRVAVMNLHVPALRERPEDIPLLVNHFATEFCRTRKTNPLRFHAEALRLLIGFAWPGNVRQLKNMVEKIVVLAESEEVGANEVAAYLREDVSLGIAPDPEDGGTLDAARKRAEREALLQKLVEYNWDYRQVASELDISRATLFNKIKEHHIPGKRPPNTQKV